jgi:hypothetical protein
MYHFIYSPYQLLCVYLPCEGKNVIVCIMRAQQTHQMWVLNPPPSPIRSSKPDFKKSKWKEKGNKRLTIINLVDFVSRCLLTISVIMCTRICGGNNVLGYPMRAEQTNQMWAMAQHPSLSRSSTMRRECNRGNRVNCLWQWKGWSLFSCRLLTMLVSIFTSPRRQQKEKGNKRFTTMKRVEYFLVIYLAW